MRLDAPRRTRYALPGLLAVTLAIAACSDTSEIGPGTVTSVRMDPDTMVVVLGQSDTAKAFPIDEQGSFIPGKTVLWVSTDPSVAAVDEDGVVTKRHCWGRC